jgi:hypothetical protein
VLQQRLLMEQDCQKMSIVGLGGTGKTQVALQFAYMVKELQPEWSIFWVTAVSMESFEQACEEIACALQISRASDDDVDDAKELVKAWLNSSRAGHWLLVVDNADDQDVLFGTEQSDGIADYFPEGDKGVIVYTTRTPEIAELARGNVVQVDGLERHDAADFLLTLLTNKDLSRNDVTVAKLLDELACLPLAIAQVAAYLNKYNMSIETYLRLFGSTEQSRVELMSREFRDDTRSKGSVNAVVTTLIASIRQLCKHDIPAAKLLAFISCLEWKSIPRLLLPTMESDMRTEEAIGTLRKYSFLAKRDSDRKHAGQERYKMHRLVHLATWDWVRRYSNPSHVMEKVVRHVVRVFPSNDYENRSEWRTYLPHTLRLLQLGKDSDAQEIAELCLLVRRCLRVECMIREVEVRLEKKSARRQRTRSPAFPLRARKIKRSR